MNARDFQDKLLGFATVLNAGGARGAAIDLRVIAKLFDDPAGGTVAAVLKRADRIGALPRAERGRTIGDLAAALSAACAWVEGVGKKTVSDDFARLLAFLKPYWRASAESLIAAVERAREKKAVVAGRAAKIDEKLVSDYVRALEATYTDPDTFRAVFERLKEDPDIRKQEAAAIATRFTERTPKTTEKDVSFARIWARHRFYVDSDAAQPVSDLAIG